MVAETGTRRRHRNDSGSTLYLVAAGMVFLLGTSALAIDLVSLYVARNEAQRTADAAALAGASIFISQGCTTGSGGCVAGGPQEAPATTQATQVAAQNLVGGQAPSSSTISVSFSYPNKEEPQITVTVYRDSGHSNPMPTFFAKVFGISTVNVSASATAEAFNPSGGGVDVGESCIRPFFVPNCDEGHPVPSTNPEANTDCGGNGTPGSGSKIACADGTLNCYPSYFFDPNNNGAIVNPGACNWTWTSTNRHAYAGYCASGGVLGQFWALHTLAGPSQWYLVCYPGSDCGASNLRNYIENCQPQTYTCGSPLNTTQGKKVGPADQGIDALINASGIGPNNGQDLICSDSTNNATAGGIDFGGSTCSSSYGATGPAFRITGGSNNPNPNLVGQTFYGASSSIVNVVVYDGHQLPPGGGSTTIIGFMQGFIVDADHTATDDEIDLVIMNIGGCGTAGSSGGGPIVDGGGSAVPIRLIHQ